MPNSNEQQACSLSHLVSLSLSHCVSLPLCAREKEENAFILTHEHAKIWLLGSKTLIAKCEYQNNQCVTQVTYYTDYTRTVFEAESINICIGS